MRPIVTVRPSASLTRVRSAFSEQVMRHRRLEAAVGQLVDAFSLPADPDVLLDEVVVGREVRVGERPVLAVAVVGRGLEVEVAQPVALRVPRRSCGRRSRASGPAS